MFNLLNKSVKTINNGISTFISNMTSESNYKTEIDFVKFGILNLNLLKINNIKEVENINSDHDFYFKEYNILYIVYSKCYLNIYYMNDELEFVCFFNQKFNHTIDKVGSIFTSLNIFCSDKLPLIGLITNKEPINNSFDVIQGSSNFGFRGNIKQAYKNDCSNNENNNNFSHQNENLYNNNLGEYCLKIYSLKTKNIVFNLRKKNKIDNFISNKKILGISFINGRIEFFNTINFEKIMKIKTMDFLITKDLLIDENNNNTHKNKKEINSNNTHTNFKINYVKDKNQVKSKISDNNIYNNCNNHHNTNNSRQNSILFDMTEDYIIFYNYKNKYFVYPSKKVELNKKYRKKSEANRKSSAVESDDNQRKNKNKDLRKNTIDKRNSIEKRKKEFSKIKNLPNKKSNSLSKSQSYGNRNSSSSCNNNSQLKNSNFLNINIKKKKFNQQDKNGFHKNFLNINYINNNNDLYHQKSNPLDDEVDNNFKYDNSNFSNINQNTFDIISTDIYEKLSKLTNWSFSQMNDFKNLHQASNVSNNSNLKLYSNSSIVTIVYFNYEETNLNNNSIPINNNNGNNTSKNPILNPIQNINNNINDFQKKGNISNSNNMNFVNTLNNIINKQNNLNIDNSSKEPSSKKILLSFNQSNILIPYFYDGLSSLKFFNNSSKYFIVGNKNSQMFYIYENFPSTNLKNNYTAKSKKSIFKTKISYSVFRGITKGVINNIDLSLCNKYLIISSNKGTFHLFSIPKKNDQINENSNLFNYEFYNDENNKIINAINIDKIKYSSFIENCGNYVFKTASKLISNFRIDIDDLENDLKKKIVKSNFNKKINANLLVNFSEYENSLYIHLIQSEKKDKNEYEGIFNGFSFGAYNSSYNNLNNNIYNNINDNPINCSPLNNSFNNITYNHSYKNHIHNDENFSNDKFAKDEKIYLIKKIDLGESLIKINSSNFENGNKNFYSEKITNINNNYKNLLHKIKQNYYKPRQNFKQFIDWETTTRNFPTMQTHPLFSFNYYKKQRNSTNKNISFVQANINMTNNNIIHTNGNLNNLIQNNRHSRNNHNVIFNNNLNSNNSNNNFQIISNSNNTLTNNNNNSNNIGLNSFVNISSSNINKNDSNTENLEIIIDNDKKEEFVNIKKKENSIIEKINNNNKNENIKKIKKEKIFSLNRNNNIKEKVKNINLKFKKQKVYENSISINSSSYSLGSSLEKNKIKFWIDKDKNENDKDINNSDDINKSNYINNNNNNLEIISLNNPIVNQNNDENETLKSKSKNENCTEEKKDLSKVLITANNINENLKFLNNINISNNYNNNPILNSNFNNLPNSYINSNSKNSIISNKSIKEINDYKQSTNLGINNIVNSNNNNQNNLNNYKILTHKKSFDSSNNNLNINNNININNYNNNYSNINVSSIDNLLTEKYICNDIEYIEINFNSNKPIIQKSDFFLDNYMGPKLIVNPFDGYSSRCNSRKNTKENNDLRQTKIISNNSNIIKEKESCENMSINVNMNNMNRNNKDDDDFFNNKEYILKKKIQEAINSNIMDKIISSSDTIVRFSGEIKIDENYIKK